MSLINKPINKPIKNCVTWTESVSHIEKHVIAGFRWDFVDDNIG